MRIDHDGMSLWYGTADAPAPAEVVADGSAVALTVGVHPADPSNSVELRYRLDGGPIQVVSAERVRTASQNAEYYSAAFPRLRSGQCIEYTAVCRCADRQVPPAAASERFPSSFRVASNERTPLSKSSAPALGRSVAPLVGPQRATNRAPVVVPPRSRDRTGMLRSRRESIRRPPLDRRGRELREEIDIQITSPRARSALRPGAVQILGTTSIPKDFFVDHVDVRIGSGPDRFRRAQPTGLSAKPWSSWSFSATLSETPGITITARMVYGILDPEGPTLEDPKDTSITVVVDGTRPLLTIGQIEPGSTVEGPGPAFSVTLRGTALDSESGLSSLTVSTRAGGFLVTAGSNPHEWNSVVTLHGDGEHEIHVKATDRAGNEKEEKRKVIARDTVPPMLDITDPVPFPHEITIPLLKVQGTASDGTGIASIRWELGGDSGSASTPSGDWSVWEASIPILRAGNNTLRFVARDKAPAGNERTIEQTFNVPALSEVQGLTIAAYMRDLLTFANARVEDKDGSKITPVVMEAAFHQPFAKLADVAITEAGTRPVSQLRVCIEALRGLLGAVPAAVGARYREAAYHSLLFSFGTSYEEIRLVRGADENARKALAARLGIAIQSNELDELRLTPEDLAQESSESYLESVFGLVDTRRAPLEDGPEPKLLQWQKQYQRIRWAKEDHPEPSPEQSAIPIVEPAPRVPIVEPDIVDEVDLSGTPQENPAFDLWQLRQRLLGDELQRLRDARSGTNALDDFDDVVTVVLGSINLEHLAAEYEKGVDIGGTLRRDTLSLSAFLHLVRIRRLAAVGTVLNVEWEDVDSILLQVRKRRDLYVSWCDEERARAITLGPDHFRVREANSTASNAASHWRRPLQDRRRWEQLLAARIAQEQGLKDSLAAAVRATEEATLPLLRDGLIATTKVEGNRVDVTDWLTRRLQLDVRASGRQRITRLRAAIETLQGVLFSLRTARLSDIEPFSNWHLAYDDDDIEDDDIKVEEAFDEEWRWVSTYESWRAAIFVFAYPENYLLPSLLLPLTHSTAFEKLVTHLRANPQLRPEDVRDKAHELFNTETDAAGDSAKTPYVCLEELINDVNTKDPTKEPIGILEFHLTEQRSDPQLKGLQRSIRRIFDAKAYNKDNPPPHYLAEICYFVPILIALQFHRAGYYLAALDWFQCVYAYNFPVDDRKIYYGLKVEEKFPRAFRRPRQWLLNGLNPHEIASRISPRANAYTHFTVMSLVRCFLDYADAEFTRATSESIPRARELYIAALDLLHDIDKTPAHDDTSLFPPNPVPASLRLHAELNLLKIRTGRNFAGLELATPPEAAGSETAPILGSGGQITLPRSAIHRPTPYRFGALIARAKELVTIAQQLEAAYLAALEKRDDEDYSLLQARQHIQLARAGVHLETLRVMEAESGVALAALQRDRAEVQFDTYREWLDTGKLDAEKAAETWTWSSAGLSGAAAVLYGFQSFQEAGKTAVTLGILGNPGGVLAQAFSSLASAASTMASLRQMQASYERRKQEWHLQQRIAQHDVLIGDQQFELASEHVFVARQERGIAETQVAHAEQAAAFLATQFTNVELYEFMSGVLGRVYAYFLQQACAIAALAENQLAFERQEAFTTFIQADYWQPPSEGDNATSADSPRPDRRGLTGSARLLQDIYRVDQHAFETKKRLLQLSHTISLANLAPFEFQRFRDTGVLPFATPMEVFDRGFPGHYLRLIRRVRLSIVALVPPIYGIRATLAASGLSRVVIADAFHDAFQTMVVRRAPEQIAFTTPINATGLLELEPEGDLLLPFEGMGVDTTWELELPKASNPLEYQSINDVLITIEYAALHSATYREQVIRQLDPSVSADRGFSIRSDFPDAFYALTNPPEDEPIVAPFETRHADFPPNVDDLRIQHVLLYVVRRDESSQEDSDTSPGGSPVTLLFKALDADSTVGGAATSTHDGIISTRRENGRVWDGMIGLVPTGAWELVLGEDMRPQLENGEIEDIVFVITYAGRLPAWPGQLGGRAESSQARLDR